MGSECVYSGFGPLPTEAPVRVMGPGEFEARMEEAFEESNGDPCTYHKEADALMCELLRSLGYAGGVKVFEGARK